MSLEKCCGKANKNVLFPQFFRATSSDCHAPVRLDEMVQWIEGAGSGWSVGGRTQWHVDQGAPLACGGTWASGKGAGARAQVVPQRPGSPLVSEKSQVTDPHPHIRVTPAGVSVCPDPTHPRSHCALQVLQCIVLTLACGQQWLAASASTQSLTAGKAVKAQREREAGQAAKKAIMCYCHRGRRSMVWTCEGEGCPVSLTGDRLPLIISISHNDIKNIVPHGWTLTYLFISHYIHYWVTTECLHNHFTKESHI